MGQKFGLLPPNGGGGAPYDSDGTPILASRLVADLSSVAAAPELITASAVAMSSRPKTNA